MIDPAAVTAVESQKDQAICKIYTGERKYHCIPLSFLEIKSILSSNVNHDIENYMTILRENMQLRAELKTIRSMKFWSKEEEPVQPAQTPSESHSGDNSSNDV